MHYEAIKTEKPCLLIRDIKPEYLDLAKPYLLDREYQVMVQVNAGVALPEQDKDYEVCIRIGDQEIRTGKPPFRKARYNRFNFRTKEPITFKAPYINAADIKSVFVYLLGDTLISSDKPVCY